MYFFGFSIEYLTPACAAKCITLSNLNLRILQLFHFLNVFEKFKRFKFF